jgi:hypothetical protein
MTIILIFVWAGVKYPVLPLDFDLHKYAKIKDKQKSLKVLIIKINSQGLNDPFRFTKLVAIIMPWSNKERDSNPKQQMRDKKHMQQQYVR